MNDAMTRRCQIELAERLERISPDFRIRYAYTSSHSDGVVTLIATRARNEADELVLEIGVACPPRLRQALRGVEWNVYDDAGLRVCSRRTERYSQFQLGPDQLESGREYRVEVMPVNVLVPVVEPPPPVWTGTELGYSVRAADDQPRVQKDDREGVRLRAERLEKDPGKRTLITLELRADLVGESVFKFELRRGQSAGGEVVRAGFVGLYPLPGEEGWHTGEVVLSLSDEQRTLAEGVGLHFCPAADNPCRLERLTPQDRELIEHALTQTLNQQSLEALRRVKHRLKTGERGDG